MKTKEKEEKDERKGKKQLERIWGWHRDRSGVRTAQVGGGVEGGRVPVSISSFSPS